jgi:hypothetical protein
MGEHFHPGMEERFTMLRGQVGFRIAGRVNSRAESPGSREQ